MINPKSLGAPALTQDMKSDAIRGHAKHQEKHRQVRRARESAEQRGREHNRLLGETNIRLAEEATDPAQKALYITLAEQAAGHAGSEWDHVKHPRDADGKLTGGADRGTPTLRGSPTG